MAIKATKLTAVLLSGALAVGGLGTGLAYVPSAQAADDTAATATETATDADAATVEKVTITNDNVKEITGNIRDNMTLDQAKAYVDVNDSPLLVAGLIGEIYIKPATTAEAQEAQHEMLDKMADVAKYAYDQLSATEKEEVPEIPAGYDYEGKGGADYFSTASPIGSAIMDKVWNDALTAAPDKKKEILVASFGTSYNSSRYATIGAIERSLYQKYGDEYSVRRAFTSQIIIDHVRARDGYWIDTVREAMVKAKAAGVTELVIQPTTLMSGEEYKTIQQNVEQNKWDGLKVTISTPLLNTTSDKKTVAKAVAKAAVADGGFKTSTLKKGKSVAYVFMGHGTEDEAAITYAQMQTTFKNLGYKNVYVSTVEGNPASTTFAKISKKVKKAGYKKVVLRPLMIVAGDHANNDMAGTDDPESLYGYFRAQGYKAKNIKCQIKGLGQLTTVQNLIVKHAAAVL